VIVVTGDWDCNKGINNPNGVYIGVTRYNSWSEVIKYHITRYNILSVTSSAIIRIDIGECVLRLGWKKMCKDLIFSS
jgi:hypothetical protein